MQKIGLKRDLRCIKPCKCGDGSYLKHGPPHPRGGVELGILGGQKIKSTGNVMNCPDNQYNLFLLTHPTPGVSGGGGVGIGGQHFKSPVNFMNCREN